MARGFVVVATADGARHAEGPVPVATADSRVVGVGLHEFSSGTHANTYTAQRRWVRAQGADARALGVREGALGVDARALGVGDRASCAGARALEEHANSRAATTHTQMHRGSKQACTHARTHTPTHGVEVPSRNRRDGELP